MVNPAVTMPSVRHFLATLALAGSLAATPAAAAPTSADKAATATVKIIKPLVLTWVQDLDLGTVLLGGTGAWTGATIGISRTGVLTCTNTNVTCSGVAREARYRVAGTNNTAVTVTAPPVTLVNQADSTKSVVLTLDGPGTINLTNSGTPGVQFGVGGSIALTSATTDGIYRGTLAVTVDYQ